MTHQRRLLILTNIAAVGSLVLSAQISSQAPNSGVEQAVNLVFPKSLRFPSDGDSQLHPYHSCPVVFSKLPDGTPDLIATGYGGDGAEIAMLAYNSGVAQVIDTVTDQQFWLTDGECEAQIANLADPDQPNSPLVHTIKVSFDGLDWLFIWDGKKLRNITALEPRAKTVRHHRPPNTAMYFTDVVDLDHAGAMQIVGQNGDADKLPQDDGISSSGTATFFQFNGSAYVAARTLLDFEKCEPTMSQPEQYSIDMHKQPASSYRLKIVNGDRDGSNRVTSAKIAINGETIVTPTEVNQGVETLTRTIRLQKQNQLTVTVDGPAKSHIYVVVK